MGFNSGFKGLIQHLE